MKKITNILLIIFILLNFTMLITNYSYANNETQDNAVATELTPRTTTITSSNNSNEDVLSFTNILLIILISIGFVLILLSIAILIRLKR